VSGSGSSNSLARHWLAHTKPRKGSSAQVLLRVRALSGSDLRDSQQVLPPNTAASGPKPRTTRMLPQQGCVSTAWALPTRAAAAALFALLPRRSVRCRQECPSRRVHGWPSTRWGRPSATQPTAPTSSTTPQLLPSSW